MKKIKKIYILPFLLLLIPVLIKATTILGINDEFLWVGNNTYNTGDSGDPSVGMIKLSGKGYSVNLEDEASGTRVLTGEAWIGVGSNDDKVGSFYPEEADSPSIGWLRFNQGVPANCTNLDSSDPNGCHPVTWIRRNGAAKDSLEGYLSGWAKFDIGKDALGTSYPETWVHFKTPLDISGFDCNTNGKPSQGNNYYVCTDSSGAFFGYAWSSGLPSSSRTDNPGFGWIGFSRAGTIVPGETTDIVSDSSCYILNDLPGSSICGSPGVSTTANLFANFIDNSVNTNNYDYQWDCNGSGSYTPGGQTQQCTYSPSSNTTYIPKLQVKPKSGTTWADCSSSTSMIKYYTGKSCQVVVKDIDNSNNNSVVNPYNSSSTIYIEKEMEAKIVRQCVLGGTVVWSQPQNGKITSYPDKWTMRTTFNPAGDGKIGAIVKNVLGGGDVTCSEAIVRVRDKVKWGL